VLAFSISLASASHSSANIKGCASLRGTRSFRQFAAFLGLEPTAFFSVVF
jgi:hypothetical protein